MIKVNKVKLEQVILNEMSDLENGPYLNSTVCLFNDNEEQIQVHLTVTKEFEDFIDPVSEYVCISEVTKNTENILFSDNAEHIEFLKSQLDDSIINTVSTFGALLVNEFESYFPGGEDEILIISQRVNDEINEPVCFVNLGDIESNMKADLEKLSNDVEILLKLKIGRNVYEITENDRFMDNGYCVQLMTQSKEISVSGFSPNPVLSKKAIKELSEFKRNGDTIFNIEKPIKNGFYIWHPKDLGSMACHPLLLEQVLQVIEGDVWLTGSGEYSMATALKFGKFGECVLTQD